MTAGSQRGPEDRLIQELLDRLNDDLPTTMGGSSEDPPTPADPSERESLEVLGLLPYALEPIEAPPAVKSKVLAAIEGSAGDTRPEGATVSPPQPAIEPTVPTTARRPRWPIGLAAVLALALLGVTVLQWGQLSRQRGTIDDLADRLHNANRQISEVEEYETGLRRAKSHLALVSSPGVEVCALRPTEGEIAQDDARGTLFVAADHSGWYMRLEGLVPCPLGRKHQIWFLRENGEAVSGGVFDVKAGEGIEISSEEMPLDTVAVMITLEHGEGSSEPSGPSVLYGDDVMRIL